MAGVAGFEPAQSGQEPIDANGNPVAVGVWGDSTTGVGVFGTSGVLPPGVDDIPINIAGVEGHSIENPGVYGASIEDTGVFGESQRGLGVLGRSSTGNGVLGVTFAPGEPPAGSGVFGSSTAGGNGVTGFVGSATGVVGSSVRGMGVRGLSGDDFGVSGTSLTGTGVRGVGGADPNGGGGTPSGVFGSSRAGPGVRGQSTTRDGAIGVSYGSGSGVYGINFSVEAASGVFGESVLGNGVEGFSYSEIGVRGRGRKGGVYGASTASDRDAGGVIGVNPKGFAGVFHGKVRVTGSLSKSGGGFEIDHPLDPDNRRLSHSFVESPDMLNVYSGNVTTDAEGQAVVTLPGYFEALNQEFRYQLTVIGQFARAMVADEIRDHRFTIKTDEPRVKVSWQVTGIRKDPWAIANRIRVETDKTPEEKGLCLNQDPLAQSSVADSSLDPPPGRLSELLPQELRPRLEQLLQPLLSGNRLDREALQSLLVAATEKEPDQPPTPERAQLEEDWRRLEAALQPTRRSPSDQTGALSERLGHLSEQMRPRLERHLHTLLRGDHVDTEDLRRLIAEAAQPAGGPGAPGLDRARFEAEWRQLAASIATRTGPRDSG